MPLVFFLFLEEETKKSCSKEQAFEYEFQHFQRKQGDMSMEKSLPISEKKNFLSSQKRRYLFFCWTNHKEKILPSAPKKYVARRKKRRRERRPLDYEIKNAGDLIALDTVVLQENGKKKYIITAIDLFLVLLFRPTSKNAADLLRRMHIALGVPMKAVKLIMEESSSSF